MNLYSRSVSPEQAKNSAALYARQISQEIVKSDSYAQVRTRIQELALQKVRSLDIAVELRDQIEVNPTTSIQTVASIIRQVARKLLGPSMRKALNSGQHSDLMRKHQRTASAARDAWMAERGMDVWSDAERAYFRELLQRPEMRRTESRYNHKKIASAMNQRFNTDRFTSAACSSRLEAIRASQKLSEKRTRLELAADVDGQFGEAVAVAPLIVVPAEDLQQPSTDHLSKGGIDDAAAAVADEVLEDQRTAFDA